MKLAKLSNGAPEIFYTIQGEGINSGRPSVFIRLSLCNLHCTWCDTPYTWNWEETEWKTTSNIKYKKKDYIIELSVAQIIDELNKYPCRNLVITGGEPLIQQTEIASLLNSLQSEWSVEIETNGTIVPDKIPQMHMVQYNVSPKLPRSGNNQDIALKPKPLNWFSEYKLSYFKFVISALDDIETIKNLQSLFNIPKQQIVLMPQGTNSEALRASSQEIIDLCLKHGYRFSDRLHVHVWGNTRAK